MKISEFLTASLEDLARLSGIDKTRWSKYFNGQVISERTLAREAKNLKMTPEELYLAISLRRKQKDCRIMQRDVDSECIA